MTAPARVSPVTRGPRATLYADAVNESLFMRPGQWLTRALVFFDNRGVDGAVNGLAAALGGSSSGWAGRRPASCAPTPSMLGGASRCSSVAVPCCAVRFVVMLLVLGLMLPLVGAAVVAALPHGRDLLAKQLTLLSRWPRSR